MNPQQFKALADQGYNRIPLTREVLAEVAGFSVPHFHRIFTKATGLNMYDYIRRVRLLRAGRKLRMGAVDITEVALAAGYRTHASFSKASCRIPAEAEADCCKR